MMFKLFLFKNYYLLCFRELSILGLTECATPANSLLIGNSAGSLPEVEVIWPVNGAPEWIASRDAFRLAVLRPWDNWNKHNYVYDKVIHV